MSKKWTVSVSQTINHSFCIEADTAKEAETIYFATPLAELLEKDLDGSSSWDVPWDISEDN